MLKNVKYGKILAVVFLSLLVWVWADLAKTEVLSVPKADLVVAKSIGPNLWVTFENGRPAVSITKLTFKGPTSKVNQLKRKLTEGSIILEFLLDLEHQGMTVAGQHTLNILDFLRESDLVKQLGLSVDSCQPQEVKVQVVELVEKTVEIKCIDEARRVVKTTAIEPAQLKMFVPEDWQGQRCVAYVLLNRWEIDQARLGPVEKRPFIELPGGQRKDAAESVKVSMPLDTLNDYTITNARLGFSFSANLQGKYRVELTNPDVVMGVISIKATAEAKRAYEKMRYHVILEIDDSDKDNSADEPLRKQLVYNFPAEHLRKDQIMLNQPPVIARFRLIPLSVQTPVPG